MYSVVFIHHIGAIQNECLSLTDKISWSRSELGTICRNIICITKWLHYVYTLYVRHVSSMVEDQIQGKDQSRRLVKQHERAGGSAGIFGEEAKRHDTRAKVVMGIVVKELREKYTDLIFRHRMEVSKKEINDNLTSVDPSLGKSCLVRNQASSRMVGLLR